MKGAASARDARGEPKSAPECALPDAIRGLPRLRGFVQQGNAADGPRGPRQIARSLGGQASCRDEPGGATKYSRDVAGALRRTLRPSLPLPVEMTRCGTHP